MTLPINRLSDRLPLNHGEQESINRSSVQNRKMAEDIAAVTGNVTGEIATELNMGKTIPIREARKLFDPQMDKITTSVLSDAAAKDTDPEEVTEVLRGEQDKAQQWFDAGDSFYIEQALGNGNPNVSAEAVRYSTNITIGERLFLDELERMEREKNWGDYALEFVDRYFIRSFPVGAYEQLTNRNERKGNELVGAALTMSPTEYEQYIRGYIQDLKDEGIFELDNYFAIQDGLYEFETQGYDPAEVFNRTVGAVELLPLVGGAAKLLKGGGRALLRARSPLAKTAAVHGPEAAAEAAVRQADNGTIDPEAFLDLQPGALDTRVPYEPIVRPNSGRMADIYNRNKIVQGVSDYLQKGARGRRVSSPEVQRTWEAVSTRLKNIANNPIANVLPPVRADIGGNYVMDVNLGTVKTGAPFKTKKFAEGNAKRIREAGDEFKSAEAVPVDPNDLDKGYYVRVQKRLDISEGIGELDYRPFTGEIRSMIGRLAGSKALTEAEQLNNLAFMAEGAGLAFGRQVKPIIKRLEKLSVKDKDTLSDIFSELRDGADAYIRDTLSRAEFNIRWEARTGKTPTDTQWQGFLDVRDVNDAAYFMAANVRLQRYVEKGYWSVKTVDGTSFNAKPVAKKLPSEERVLDASTNTTVRMDSLPKNTKVWETDGSYGTTKYIVKPNEVKPLAMEDVLGYNTGGRRLNPDANHFVVANGRAFMSTFTAKQAGKAMDDINTLLKAWDEGRLTDDLVREHVEWNPELQTADMFTDWAKKKGISPKKGVSTKARDDAVSPEEPEFEFASRYGEAVIHQYHRSDEPLMEYGGGVTPQANPITAMFDDFSSEAQLFAHNVQTQTAIVSWVKAAAREGTGWQIDPTGDYLSKFRNARNVGTTRNPANNQLARQRGIIENRLNVKSTPSRMMEQFGNQMQEFVYEKTGKKVGSDPVGSAVDLMLKLGFNSAFGFFNASQFVVQGFHGMTIMAISPRAGAKALPLAVPLRFILNAPDEATRALGRSRLAKLSGMSEDEVQELMDYIRIMGRADVEAAAVENGSLQQWGITGYKGERMLETGEAGQAIAKGIRTASEVGLAPFREGERMARLMGAVTAHIEFKAQYPGISAASDFGRKWIAKRDDALTFRMTNANRAVMQDGLAKLPTQWFSYSMRAMENVIAGRGFTAGERVRMAMFLGPMFGMTGVGAGYFASGAVDWAAEKLGSEPAGELYTAIKYGAVDWALEAMSGGEVELALAERLAPITLFTQLWEDVVGGRKTALQIALGPSGDIASGFLGSLMSAVGNITNGNSVMMQEDLLRTVRNISGVDNVFKAQGIMQNGVYRSRTGKVLPIELDTSDAVGALLGFAPREVNEWYGRQRMRFWEDRKVRDMGKKLGEDWKFAKQMYDDGNKERALEIMREIELTIKLSGFTKRQQDSLIRGLEFNMHEDLARMIERELQNNRPYVAETIEESFTPLGSNE